jgi:anti-sigma regulatory factor (Ser/Thr protein kinase)
MLGLDKVADMLKEQSTCVVDFGWKELDCFLRPQAIVCDLVAPQYGLFFLFKTSFYRTWGFHGFYSEHAKRHFAFIQEGFSKNIRFEIMLQCHDIWRQRRSTWSRTGEIAITAYRLIQEGLSNVVKHACATGCSVCILNLADKDVLEIDIRDNGQGFNPDAVGPGIGLIGMKERVHGAAGELTIHSQLRAGTKIMIRLPKSHGQSLPGCWKPASAE